MENERLLAKIEELMKQRGYSRYRLSQLSGIKQSTLTTMFNKRSTVSIDTLTKISKAFGMKCSEFLSLVEDTPEEHTAKDFPVSPVGTAFQPMAIVPPKIFRYANRRH